MGWLDGPIEQGTYHGLTVGVFEHLRVLIDEAQEVYDRVRANPYWEPISYKQKGCLNALVELGIVRKRGFWLFRKWEIVPEKLGGAA